MNFDLHVLNSQNCLFHKPNPTVSIIYKSSVHTLFNYSGSVFVVVICFYIAQQNLLLSTSENTVLTQFNSNSLNKIIGCPDKNRTCLYTSQTENRIFKHVYLALNLNCVVGYLSLWQFSIKFYYCEIEQGRDLCHTKMNFHGWEHT